MGASEAASPWWSGAEGSSGDLREGLFQSFPRSLCACAVSGLGRWQKPGDVCCVVTVTYRLIISVSVYPQSAWPPVTAFLLEHWLDLLDSASPLPRPPV